MKSMKNQRGSVLVFATLMIVLLLIMVGIGLDTGWITYVRGLGQPAVDAAALAGASALPLGEWPVMTEVNKRVAAFNATNDYVKSGGNPITTKNVTGVIWNPVTGEFVKALGPNAPTGIRVALEETNPYGGPAPNTAINAPLFLTPLFNVLGISMAKTTNINVSAVAVVQGIPSMPIAIAGCPPPGACEEDVQDGIRGKKCKLALSPPAAKSGWTSFNIPSPSAEDIKAMINEPGTCSGNIPAVEVGSKICLYGGSPPDSIYDDLKNFYSTNGDGLSGPPSTKDCGLIPVVDASVTTFTGCDKPIRSFAKLCIRDVSTGSPKYVYGDISCNQKLYSPYNTGATCFIPRLVRDTKSGM